MSNKRMVALTLLVSLPLLIHACALSGGPIDGQVLDETTGKPVPGTIVAASWTADYTNIFAGGASVCYHVDTARADTNGRFHINEFRLPSRLSDLRAAPRDPILEAYKPGYDRPVSIPKREGDVYVRPFVGTVAQYRKHLSDVTRGNNCAGGGDSRRNLYRLLVPILEEYVATAKTDEEKQGAEFFSIEIESLRTNFTKPVMNDRYGIPQNVNPGDSYSKEELLR